MGLRLGYNGEMRLAAMDIGSNTIRLLVADCHGGEVWPLRHERKVTRMASGLHLSGMISRPALEETTRTLESFAAVARQEGAERITMAGTSALRDASNAPEAVRALEGASGLRLEIISGENEARIMAMGVLSGIESGGRAIIFDIGGGSTEFIALDEGEVLRAVTLPAGVVRMVEEFLHDDPPSRDDMDSLDRHAALMAHEALEGLGRHAGDGSMLIGTAGTATTLASLDMGLERYDRQRVQGHVLSLEKICDLEAYVKSLPLDIRKKIKGMDPERADLIIAGARLTIRTMKALGFEHMTVSDHGLLEGLIVRLSREAQ
jgi:exopolyphosphatase/guanosine-5'-triphosphate,3'-diphosphate pyrophosphatase